MTAALPLGARVERTAGDAGTVVAVASDRVRVEWDRRENGTPRPLEWLPRAMVRPIVTLPDVTRIPTRCEWDDATRGACTAHATHRITVRCHGRARGVVSVMCAEHVAYVTNHGVEAMVEPLPDDAEVGRRIDASAPWVRRLTVLVEGTQSTVLAGPSPKVPPEFIPPDHAELLTRPVLLVPVKAGGGQ